MRGITDINKIKTIQVNITNDPNSFIKIDDPYIKNFFQNKNAVTFPVTSISSDFIKNPSTGLDEFFIVSSVNSIYQLRVTFVKKNGVIYAKFLMLHANKYYNYSSTFLNNIDHFSEKYHGNKQLIK